MCTYVLYPSGMQQIYDQIQQRLEEKQLQEEMKEQERQQIRENQEIMNLEDLKVRTQGGDTARAETMHTNQNIKKYSLTCSEAYTYHIYNKCEV